VRSTDAVNATGPSALGIAGRRPARRTINVDLNEYCRSQHGPGYFPTRRVTDNHPLCTKQDVAGGSQVHIVVDVAKACPAGTSFDRVDGETLVCASLVIAGEAGSPSSNEKSGGKEQTGVDSAIADERDGSQPSSRAPPTRSDNSVRGAVSSSVDTNSGTSAGLPPQLVDCGIVSGIDFSTKNQLDPEYKRRFSWEIESPCPGLTGGTAITELDSYCGYYDMTRPAGSRISREIEVNSPTYETMFLVFGWDGNRPTCEPGVQLSGGVRSMVGNPVARFAPDVICYSQWYRTKGFDFAGLNIIDERPNNLTATDTLKFKFARDFIPASVNEEFPDIAYRYVNRQLTCFYYPRRTFDSWRMSTCTPCRWSRQDPAMIDLHDVVDRNRKSANQELQDLQQRQAIAREKRQQQRINEREKLLRSIFHELGASK
jgi:hypothetical protein